MTPTPRPDGPSDRQSLNGIWEFTAETAEGPDQLDGNWNPHSVPAEWTHEGYEVDSYLGEDGWKDVGPSDYERGWYRREFAVDDDWDGSRLKLRFGAVYTHGEVWVNGQRLGEHDGGYTPFEFDVTGIVDTGESNTITVAVAEETLATDMGWGTGRGGITRDVTLFAVPDCHLSACQVETELPDEDGNAIVRVLATVTNEGEVSVDDAVLTVDLTDPDGNRAASVEEELDLIDPGEELQHVVELELSEYTTWDPVHPELYDLDATISAGGEEHAVDQRVGIREIDVEGTELLVNGQPVTLRGVNWEEVHEDHGQSVPAEQTYQDMKLLREANVNYVRTAHHPPSEALLDACDELGLFVEVEAPFFQLDAADPYDDDLIVQQTAEMVERDRSHTSVFCWSLGNEGDPGGIEGHYDAAATVDQLDGTRPVIYHYDQWNFADDTVDPLDLGVDVANHHYPATRPGFGVQNFAAFEIPVLFGEFGHTYTYNGHELATDPGERDAWVAVFEKTWEQVRDVDACIGAAIWAGGDQIQPARGVEDGKIVGADEYRWGLVDGLRRPRPELWHVTKIYSPVQVVSTDWSDDELVVDVENRCEFSTLAEHTVEWQAGDDSGELDPEIAPGETGTVTIPVSSAEEAVLRVDDRRGFTVNTFEFTRREASVDAPATELGSDAVSGTANAITIDGADYTATIDRETGHVEITHGDDPEPIVDGIDIGMTPSEDGESPPYYGDALEHRLDGRSLQDVQVVEGGGAAEITVEYDVATGTVLLRPLEEGIHVEYEYTLTEEQDSKEAGIVFSMTEDHETLSWTRDADWSTYPDAYDHIGRENGTARAFPTGERPEDDVARLNRDVQWADGVTKHGSNDFRSTKRNALSTTLTNADDGLGAQLWPRTGQHVRSMVRDDTVDMFVLDRRIGGVGLSFLDRLMLLGEDATVESGTGFSGAVTLGVAVEN
ncbi:glycoside hydrolase family 2 protein [Natranaeroarchaeum aerophilus]|uniref:Beta galactosidase jelly roll domain-containing protein n=1 Tax=Natranaeroarchaeum aerophilus TaxID=2917711 RepID=A0AAE3K5T2_9EURY|nr:glycoside hydrolase family 2 TIM barrel-domain containing protein [Natranaeroarchaeum aerophilus]MCL9814288.1 beta galactosidase jelly roll domain-containing protein [Natranaeroarchaeum aerophilus]